MGGNVGLVDIAKKGISTQLILWPDDHRQNVWPQYFMYYTYGIRREGQKVVVKPIGRHRKYTRVIRVFARVKVRINEECSYFATILKKRRFCRARKKRNVHPWETNMFSFQPVWCYLGSYVMYRPQIMKSNCINICRYFILFFDFPFSFQC